MHDRRYGIHGMPHASALDLRRGPQRSGLRRWLIVCAAVPVASCQQTGVLDPRGPIGSAERLLLISATEIMLVVVVPVILATLGFAWWYRSSNPRASRSGELAYEGRIDFVVWSIPVHFCCGLAGRAALEAHYFATTCVRMLAIYSAGV
jgi:cytochrome o ubiquinol oxidase subunit 2